MFRTLGALSLRTKITASFVLIVVFGTAMSTWIGSRIVTRAVLEQARNRAHHGLETARLVYSTRLDNLCRLASQLADPGWGLSGAVEQGLDFLIRIERGEQPPDPFADLVERARNAGPVAGTERVSGAAAGADGIVMVCAAPASRASRAGGIVLAGVLLDGNHEIAGQIQELVFGGETYDDRSVGTAGILRDGLMVASSAPELWNVTVPGGGGAEGGRPPEDVWYERVVLSEQSYLYAFAPLLDHAGGTSGVLAVGLLEAPFLAVRTDMMLSFLVVAMLALLVLLGLTYLITRNTIRPLEEMAAATRRIAQGDLDTRVEVRADDEIGQLAGLFNRMLDSLRRMKSELESWGQTLEEKVRSRTEQLAVVQKQMLESEKMASLGRMAAGVAHELNNPLGGILSLSMLSLEDVSADHEIREDLETISKQALRCREIVRGLLDFSRGTERSSMLTDVKAAVEATLALLERQAAFHDVSIVQRLEEGLPPVRIDPGQLQQVLMNLLLNAVDAMEQQGTLTIVCERARVDEEVLIRVGDTGRGIPDDVLPYIFEPFFTTKKVGEGTGLGLSIAHGIVTRAGGRIQVRSDRDGTTFTVRLPLAGAARSQEESDGEVALSGDRAGQSPSGR